jgi:hypothetical protein
MPIRRMRVRLIVSAEKDSNRRLHPSKRVGHAFVDASS